MAGVKAHHIHLLTYLWHLARFIITGAHWWSFGIYHRVLLYSQGTRSIGAQARDYKRIGALNPNLMAMH
jgi:hypothetical protein